MLLALGVVGELTEMEINVHMLLEMPPFELETQTDNSEGDSIKISMNDTSDLWCAKVDPQKDLFELTEAPRSAKQYSSVDAPVFSQSWVIEQNRNEAQSGLIICPCAYYAALADL